MKAELGWSYDADVLKPGEPILIYVLFHDQERYTLEQLAAVVAHALEADGHEVSYKQEPTV